MKRTKLKKGYMKSNGTAVGSHMQNYSYRDFAKMRLKKILAMQKQKNVMLAMKQMGKEWATAKHMKSEDIKKNYSQIGGDYFSNRKKLLDLAERTQKDYLMNANLTNENKVVDSYALIENLDRTHGYSKQTAEMKKNMAKTLDVSVDELRDMARPLIRYGSVGGENLTFKEANAWSKKTGRGIAFRTGGQIKGFAGRR